MDSNWNFIYEDHNADLFPFYLWVDFHLEDCGLDKPSLEKRCLFSKGTVSYWVKKSDYSASAKEVYDKIIFGNYFDKIEEKTNIALKGLLDLVHRLEQESPRNLSNEDLWQRYSELEEKMAGAIRWGATPTAMDFAGDDLLTGGVEQILQRAIEQAGLTLNASEALATLSMPSKGTFLREEKIERLKIGILIQRQERWNSLFKMSSEDIAQVLVEDAPELDAELIEHARRFGWLNYGYQGPALPVTFFISEIKQDLTKNLDIELKNTLNEEDLKERECRTLLEKLSLDSVTKKRLEISRKFGYWKNYRKEIGFYAFWAFERYHREMAKRLGLTLRQIRYLLPEELHECLIQNIAPDVDLLNSRYQFCIYPYEDHLHSLVSGNVALRQKEAFKKKQENLNFVELKGQCACPGLVQGPVKIILSAEDSSKMKANDVLVSFSTNPNMIASMKIASAIVTEVGGVTCHAAIVSRELKIPCIIGTKVATRWLKDGDFVEVDATRGIIRKINA